MGVPHGDDTANVGIGVLAPSQKPGDVKRCTRQLDQEGPRLSFVDSPGGPGRRRSVSPPAEQSVMNGLILVGDSACIIDPITGGGIANGLFAGKYAGDALATRQAGRLAAPAR